MYQKIDKKTCGKFEQYVVITSVKVSLQLFNLLCLLLSRECFFLSPICIYITLRIHYICILCIIYILYMPAEYWLFFSFFWHTVQLLWSHWGERSWTLWPRCNDGAKKIFPRRRAHIIGPMSSHFIYTQSLCVLWILNVYFLCLLSRSIHTAWSVMQQLWCTLFHLYIFFISRQDTYLSIFFIKRKLFFFHFFLISAVLV